MVEYSKVNVKLTDTQLKKLKTAVKNKTGTTLRMSLKMFGENDLPHESLLTTRQKTKLRNAVNPFQPEARICASFSYTSSYVIIFQPQWLIPFQPEYFFSF